VTSQPPPPITPGPGDPYAAHLQPAVPNLEDAFFREVQMMQAAGWTLHQRWPGGADFHSVSKPGISLGIHILLLVLTCGLWLLAWIPIALFSGNQNKWCRLTFDEYGRPQYQETGYPGR
jgi:hypothetical protein